MATLVIVDWKMKRFQNSGFDNLIEKIKPKTIKIVHSPECDVGVDLIGDSIYRKNLLKGIDISLHPHTSVIQGPRFKRGEFDEESHWGTNVSALIKELDLDIGTHIEDKDLHICATGGSSYLLGCLMTVGEVIGGHIWTLLPNNPAFIPEAIEVTMDSSFELSHEADTPTTRSLKEKESGMLSIMAERGNCEMKDWIPGDAIASTKYDLARQQGLSTTAKSLEEGGMIERRGAEPVEYRLTDMGLIHAIYHLSKNEFRLEPRAGSEGAVIIFHNGKESPDEESKRVTDYLDEHGLPGGVFSKYALIVLEYGNDRDRAEKVAERIEEVLPLYNLINKDVKSISNLMCEGELEFYDSLGRLLNVIRDASEGYRGKCSLVIDKIPSHLKSSVLRYCRISGISVISILKKRPSTGITGSNTETKLGKLKHRFRLPNDFEIEAVRKGIEISSREKMEDSRNARRVLATILYEKDTRGRGIESSKKLGRYNQEHVSGDLMLADPDGATGRQQRSRGINAAEKNGLIRREGKESLSLTAAGEVLARLSLMRGR